MHSHEISMKIAPSLNLYREENRKATFKNWIFGNNVPCNAAKMAEAGFYFVGSEDEPDTAKCFLCDKSLDSWDSDDDPWAEHLKHSKNCGFAKLNKPENACTLAEFLEFREKYIISTMKRFLDQRVWPNDKVQMIEKFHKWK